MAEENTNSTPETNSDPESLFTGKLLIRFIGGIILVMLLIGVGILLFA